MWKVYDQAKPHDFLYWAPISQIWLLVGEVYLLRFRFATLKIVLCYCEEALDGLLSQSDYVKMQFSRIKFTYDYELEICESFKKKKKIYR